MPAIDRDKLKKQLELELQAFIDKHPESRKMYERAQKNMVSGVPMNWMVKWAGAFPLFVREAVGAHFIDVDGHKYLDLCLGDTGAMTGHAPAAAVEAIQKQIAKGATFMLPTEDCLWVADELKRRFNLPYWQFAMTATDANRFSIRLARHITGRKKILVFNWCYHGTVDETFVVLRDGKAVSRNGNIGAGVDPTVTTKVVEFNDVAALKDALADHDVACVLAEPVLTNIGIVHAKAGFHDELRKLTRETGTLLILDETHTICTSPGGYTAQYNLRPDILTCGKPIASGIPAAAYGFSSELAEKIQDKIKVEDCDTGGIGGTLAGNALSMAAMRATLEHVLTDEAYAKSIPLAKRFADGVQSVIEEYKLPWSIQQLGCRAEYWFRETPPANGSEAAAAADYELDRFMHLAALNRGILMTPFHNMALVSPATTEADIDAHTRVFAESVRLLLA